MHPAVQFLDILQAEHAAGGAQLECVDQVVVLGIRLIALGGIEITCGQQHIHNVAGADIITGLGGGEGGFIGLDGPQAGVARPGQSGPGL